MRIFVDATEPGVLLQKIRQKSERAGIPVERTILYKRDGFAASQEHPFYGFGCDYVIADDGLSAVSVIERKTLDDLARSLSIGEKQDGSRLFRQLSDLARHPMPMLFLEGQPSYMYHRFEAALLGFQFWCARNGIATMYSTSLDSTAKAIHLIARKLATTYDTPVRNELASFSRMADEGVLDADER